MSRLPALLASLIIASSLPTQLGAQAAAPAERIAAASRAADETAIRSLEDQERTGVLRQDFAALERIWSEHFMVNAPMNVVAPNRAVVLEIFRKGLAHYSSFERRIENVLFEGDLVIVMGAETVKPIGSAPMAGHTVERRFTHIWKKEQGAWRLLARHANNVSTSS